MKRKLQLVLTSGMIMLGVAGATLVPAAPAAALDPAGTIRDGVKDAGGAGGTGLPGQLKIIVNILLFVLGAIAVIMIIIGGIRYTLSGGDSSAITAAKNTILYAIIGVVVAILAYAIVNWVIDRFV